LNGIWKNIRQKNPAHCQGNGGFVQLSVIAVGILQITSLKFSGSIVIKNI